MVSESSRHCWCRNEINPCSSENDKVIVLKGFFIPGNVPAVEKTLLVPKFEFLELFG